MNVAWLCLFAAGLFEIGWPVGLKNGWSGGAGKPLWLLFAVFCMAASGTLLFYAQRSIPMGTAYAVWTGIGAVGTFAVGVAFFGDSASALRLVSVLLITVGVMGLKFA
jgi:quaternary ammonium compound-resistance protein SugE